MTSFIFLFFRNVQENDKKQLYNIMQESSNNRTDDKVLFMEEKILELTKYPDGDLDFQLKPQM